MKLMWKYASRYPVYLCLIVVMVIVSVAGMLALPMHLSSIIATGIKAGDTQHIIKQGLFMLGWALLSLVAMLFMSFLSARVSIKIGQDMRAATFERVMSFSPGEMDQFSTASLITRTNNDVMMVQNFILLLLGMMLMAPVLMIGGLIMSLIKSPMLSIVLFVAIPLIIVTLVLISKKAIPLAESIQGNTDGLNLIVREQITGIRVVRAFTNEAHEAKRFAKANGTLFHNAYELQRYSRMLTPVLTFLINMTTAAMIYIGGTSAALAAASGDIIAMTQIVSMIMIGVVSLCFAFLMYPRAATSAQRISEVLDMQCSIVDPPNPVKQTHIKGEVEFRDVSFSYKNAPKPALSHITFSTKPGEITAIIGSTGSGKSTLLNLIPRLYDVAEGQVLVDGVDVKQYALKPLREKIGYVLQKAVLFRGTIGTNLSFYDTHADAAAIESATRTAQAYDFISQKEGALDSPIAQGGSNVSGGQRQRLAIARALVTNPEILLFDDSFSALDFKTDATLRRDLATKTTHSAVIIVAQRVSTIMNATRIIVLEKGEMVGMGTHHELLKTCVAYREIAESQMTAEEVGA